MRVVSLVPSVTETLTAWNVEPIACTRFCERPELPHVGGTKNPEIAAIIGMEPDLVVLDQQENRREDADTLTEAGLQLCVLDVRSIEGLATELATLADATGVTPSETHLPRFEPLGVAAFVPIWRRPWMAIGPDTYGSTLLARLGIANICADRSDGYPEVALDDAVARAPGIVLVPSEPYAFTDAHIRELDTIAPAVRVDGQDLFWWGTRTPAALQRLHSQLAPLIRRQPARDHTDTGPSHSRGC